MHSINNLLKIENFIFPYGELDKNNRWVKLLEIIPWNEFEETYATQFINNGRPSKPLSIVLGSLIITQKLNFSDSETVSDIAECACHFLYFYIWEYGMEIYFEVYYYE